MTRSATLHTGAHAARPRWPGNELALRLVRRRYEALAALREVAGEDGWFSARMGGRAALVVSGEEGVRTFYDPGLVVRRGAVPALVRLTLFGPGAVHGLDGEAHGRRKGLFLRLLTACRVSALVDDIGRRLDDEMAGWTGQEPVVLFDRLVDVYGSAVLEWAGTGVSRREAVAVGRDLATIVDGFGIGGTPYPAAVLARVRAERWAVALVREVRAGRRRPAEDTLVAALAAVPRQELSDLAAATELLNVLRPTVAVAYFGAYAAHALVRRPDWREPLAAGSPEHRRAFEHEVRRWYPFTPLLAGRLRRTYRWQGRTFPARSWIVLDVLGTNRDPALWEDPEEFRPERFLGREPGPYDYVPHGGGDPAAGHRCPGEPLAARILEVTLSRLARWDLQLSEDSHDVPLDRIPSLPQDRLTLVNLVPAPGSRSLTDVDGQPGR